MNSIGKMRYKIEVQSPVNTTDTGGGSTRTWSTVSTRWANIIPKSGNESYRQGQVQETLTHEVTIRWLENIGTNYRLKYGNRLFNIKNLKNIDERGRYIVMQCEEGVAV